MSARLFKSILVFIISSIISFSVLFFVGQTYAATGINRKLNFQGKIVNKTDSTNIANGNYSFTFKLYDAASGGTQLPSGAAWSETQTLTVTDGLFQATIGGTTTFPQALDFNSDSIYLDITFNSESFGSRVRLTAVPYAFNAEKVNGLTVTATTGTLTIPDGTTIQFAGTNNLTISTTGITGITLPTSGTLTAGIGSSNALARWISANNLSTGITYDDGSLLGVGTTAPNLTRLYVLGVGSTTNFALRIADSSGLDRVSFLNNGNVGFGTTNPSGEVEIVRNNGRVTFFSQYGEQWFERNDDIAGGPNFFFYKSRGNLSAKTAVVQHDDVGNFYFTGYDGANYRTAAQILGEVDGGVSSGDMPGRLSFFTTPDGTATGIERLRINNAGNVGIGTTTIASKLTVGGNGSFGVGYTGIAAPTDGLIVQGNVGIGSTGRAGFVLDVAGSLRGTTIVQNGFNVCDSSGWNCPAATLSGGATNYLARWISATQISTGISYDNGTNFGIGTTNPVALLSVGVGQTSGFFVLANGNVGIGTTDPAYRFEAISSNTSTDGFRFVQNDGTLNERDVFTILDNDGGGGSQDEGSVLKVTKGASWDDNDDGSSLVELTYNAAVPGVADRQFYITGRGGASSSEGVISWGVSLTDSDFWTSGSFRGGATGTDCGGTGVACFNSPTIALETSGNSYLNTGGNFGIGTVSPVSKLAVAGNVAIGVAYTGVAAPTNGLIVQGNVGIGSTGRAGYVLDVAGTSNLVGTTISQLYVTGISSLAGTTASQFHSTGAISGGSSLVIVGNSNLAGTTVSQFYVTGVSTLSGTTSSQFYVTGVSALSGATASQFHSTGAISGGTTLNILGVSNLAGTTVSQFHNSGSSSITGNVGIGTSSPVATYKLYVAGAIYGTTLTQNGFGVCDSSGWNCPASALSGGATNYLARWISATQISTGVSYDNGSFVGIGYTVAAGNPKLIVNGNVGIGTTNPTSPLQFLGTDGGSVQFGEPFSGYGGIALQSGAMGAGNYFAVGSNFETVVNGPSGGFFKIAIGNTPHITLDPNGNLGIGVTYSTSKVTIAGNTIIGAGFTGSVAPVNGLIVQGNVGIGSTGRAGYVLDVAGTSNLVGTTISQLYVTGISSLAGTTASQFHSTGAISGATTLNIVGLSTLAGSTASQFYSTGAIAGGSTLTITGLSTLAGATASQFYSTGAISGGSTLNITGLSTLAGTTASQFHSTGAISGGTTLNILGLSTLAGTTVSQFHSTGAIAGGSSLTITGLSTLAGATASQFHSTGAISGGSTLNITGVSNLAGTTISQFYNSGTSAFADNVGIGTSSPVATYKLYVAGAIYGTTLTQNGFGVCDSSGWNCPASALSGGATNYLARWISATQLSTGISYDNGSFLGVGYAAAVSGSFLVNGNVGIGTTAPSGRLELQSGSTQILWAGTSGNVGIGTTSPTNNVGGNFRTLDIQGGWGSNLRLGTIGSTQWDIRNHYTYFYIDSDGTNRVTINPSGSVGIGTTFPVSRLTIAGNQSIGVAYSAVQAPTNGLIVQGNVGIGSTGRAGYLLDVAGSILGTTITQNGFNVCDSSGWNCPTASLSGGRTNYLGRWISATQLSTGISYDNGSFLGIGYTAAASGALLINGNVGIGTTNPGVLLHVGAGTLTGYAPTSETVAVRQDYSTNTDHLTATVVSNWTGTDALSVQGLESWISTNHSSGNVNLVLNHIANSEHRNTGTIGSVKLFSGAMIMDDGSGSITNMYSFASAPVVRIGTAPGTITNFYGLYLDAQPTSGVTNPWGVYQLGSTDKNYFAGNIGVGTTNAADKVHVMGNVLVGAQVDSTAPAYTLTNSAAGTFDGQTNVNGVNDMTVYKGKLFISTKETDAAAVYRYDGGGTPWKLVTNAAGKAISGDTAAGGGAYIDSYKLIVYNGKLYIGSDTGTSGSGAVYFSSDADTSSTPTWTIANSVRGRFQTSTGHNGVADFALWNGQLYATTKKTNASEILRYNGRNGTTSPFQLLNTAGQVGSIADSDATILGVFFNRLWAGANSGIGSTSARVAAYEGNGTTWTNLVTTMGQFQAGAPRETAVTSMTMYNGSVFIGTQGSNNHSGSIYRYLGGPALTTNQFMRVDNGTSRISQSDPAVVDSVNVLRTYNGRLYAGSGTNTGQSAAVYEYAGVGSSWAQIGSPTLGTFGSQTNIDNVTASVELNGTLYIGTEDLTGNNGSVYTWTKTAGNSYALKFDSGNANYAAISFVEGERGNNGNGHDGNFIISHSLTTTTQAFDYAEDYPTVDVTLEAGDIVELDENNVEYVKKGEKNSKYVGIISERPGFRLSISEDKTNGITYLPVALIGRVPVKVSTENGAIKPGDYLTGSSIAGVAAKAKGAGAIVGQAMEGYDGVEIGKVMAYVQSGHIPSAGLASYLPEGLSLGDDTSLEVDASTGDKSLRILKLLSKRNEIATPVGEDISKVIADRVIAGLDIISPSVVTNSLTTDKIRSASGSGVMVQLSETGTLSVGGEDGVGGVTIDSKGNADFKGILTADTIRAKQIEGFEVYTNKISRLDDKIASLEAAPILTLEKPVASTEAILTGLTVDGTATISSRLHIGGSALIEGILNVIDTITSNNLIVGKWADFIGKAIFRDEVTFVGRTTFNKDTAGYAVVKKDSDRVEVSFDREYDTVPVVNVSLSLDVADDKTAEEKNAYEEALLNEGYTALVTRKTKKGFIIRLNKKTKEDLTISWVALSTNTETPVSEWNTLEKGSTLSADLIDSSQ